jgi:hypothetical protein
MDQQPLSGNVHVVDPLPLPLLQRCRGFQDLQPGQHGEKKPAVTGMQDSNKTLAAAAQAQWKPATGSGRVTKLFQTKNISLQECNAQLRRVYTEIPYSSLLHCTRDLVSTI